MRYKGIQKTRKNYQGYFGGHKTQFFGQCGNQTNSKNFPTKF